VTLSFDFRGAVARSDRGRHPQSRGFSRRSRTTEAVREDVRTLERAPEKTCHGRCGTALPSDVVTGKDAHRAGKPAKGGRHALFERLDRAWPVGAIGPARGVLGPRGDRHQGEEGRLTIPERLVCVEDNGNRATVEVSDGKPKSTPTKVQVKLGISDGPERRGRVGAVGRAEAGGTAAEGITGVVNKAFRQLWRDMRARSSALFLTVSGSSGARPRCRLLLAFESGSSPADPAGEGPRRPDRDHVARTHLDPVQRPGKGRKIRVSEETSRPPRASRSDTGVSSEYRKG